MSRRATLLAMAVVIAASTAEAAPRSRRCQEVSAITGYRRCSRLGSSWSTPRWVPSLGVDLGSSIHRLSLVPSSTTVARGSVTPRQRESTTATTASLRLSAAWYGRFYVAVEASAGSVERFDATPGGLVRGGGVAGLQFGSIVLLAAELAVGHEMILDRMHASAGREPTIVRRGLAADARARASLWLTPWITGGISVGASLNHDDEASVGLFFALHGRAYDGR